MNPPEFIAKWTSSTLTERASASSSLLSMSKLGWPLVIAGTLKVVYDLTPLKMFRDVKLPWEQRQKSWRPE